MREKCDHSVPSDPEVMQRCGYTSMPTFSRTVRRWWGVSPQHLRILARNSGDIGKYAL